MCVSGSLPAGGPGYRLLRFLVRGLLRRVWGLCADGFARLPQRGPFIIACNHPSEIDAIVLAAALPFRPTYLASRHIEQFPILFWLARQFDPVFVRRGLSDIGAIRACLQRLEGGEVIVVFPEGRVVQDAELGPLHEGAAFLSIRSRAPVVPVALVGMSAMWPLGARWPRRARITVRVGAPVPPPDDNGKRAETLTADIDAALRRLITAGQVESPAQRESH